MKIEEDGDQVYVRTFDGQEVPNLFSVGDDFNMTFHVTLAQLADEQILIIRALLRQEDTHGLIYRIQVTCFHYRIA